jgi:hypothetical protein
MLLRCGPRLALALPVVTPGQAPDVSRHHPPPKYIYIFIYHARDQLANNNKGWGEKKRNNYATLGDMQDNSAI